MDMQILLDKISLADYPFAHCGEMCCEHSFGSIGESAAHPPERLGEHIHGG